MNLLILFLSEEEMNDCHLIVLGYMENNEIGQVGCLWYSMSRTNCNHKHESMLLSIGWGTFMSYILGVCNLSGSSNTLWYALIVFLQPAKYVLLL